MNEEHEKVLAALPEDGSEVLFQDWKQNIIAAGVNPNAIRFMAISFNRNFVSYRNDRDSVGAPVLYVSRKQEGGE